MTIIYICLKKKKRKKYTSLKRKKYRRCDNSKRELKLKFIDMKKITIMAALLGSVYFANAQVGIGTSAPSTSAQLDIVAENKGILIPRVELTDVNTFAPITGTQEESLLVYNTIDRTM